MADPTTPPPDIATPHLDDGFAWRVLRDVQQALLVVNGRWRLVWANPHAEAFFGVSLKEHQGHLLWQMFPDIVGTRIERLYREASEQGTSQRAEVFYPATESWFDVRATPSEDGLLISYNDITRRMKAERANTQQARLYREMTEQLSDVLTRSILAGPLVWVSRSATETLGWTADDLDGAPLMSLVVEEDHDALIAVLRDAVLTGKDIVAEARIRHKNGGFRHMAMRGRIVDGATPDAPKELILTSRDITEAVASRRALEDALAAAEAATQAKSAFLANMSHEIRTPLHGVIGMTSLLLDTPLQAEQVVSVEVIRSSGQALLAVINDVLDISKIEAGALVLVPREVNLRRCIEEALDIVTSQAAEKDLDLTYTVDPHVPSTVELDPGRLRQVLLNLLGNAVKFTDRGGVVVRVSVEQRLQETCRLRFSVTDTGPGIPKDRQSDLFQPFHQLDNSYTRKHGGTGLGLSISRRLVELMGGEIDVQSEAGAGATFYFTIPVVIVPPSERVSISSPPPSFDGLHVLIVASSAVQRDLLLRLCASWNMIGTAFDATKNALTWLRGDSPCELAILDVNVPGTADATLASGVRTLREDVAIVTVTAVDDNRTVPEAVARLTKPIKQTHLYKIIVAHVRKRASPPDPPRHPMNPRTDVMNDTINDARPRRLRVLLAEDNEVNQLVGRMMLSRIGVEVDVVSDGHAAVAAALAQRYDVVLMDLHMPELDGIGAARLIRAASTHQPWIIALTASALEEDRQRCLAAGMNDHLTKPMTRETLQAAIDRAIEGRGAVAEIAQAPGSDDSGSP